MLLFGGTRTCEPSTFPRFVSEVSPLQLGKTLFCEGVLDCICPLLLNDSHVPVNVRMWLVNGMLRNCGICMGK